MNLINENENKIMITQNIFKWLKKFKQRKDTIIITPLTKINELISFKNGNILKEIIISIIDNYNEEVIDIKNLLDIKNKVNKIFNVEIISIDISIEKVIKKLLNINEEIEISSEFVVKYLDLLDKYSTKQIKVIISGFNFDTKNYSMISVYHVVQNSIKKLNWSNIESLVLLDTETPFEVLDKDKFKSWLELKTKTVLQIKDIENYFINIANMNSFLIDRALKSIK